MDAQEVEAAIRSAFPEHPIPKPEIDFKRVHPADRSSAKRFRLEMGNRRWSSFSPPFLSARRFRFPHLKPEAYRYYLPAFLIGGLQNRDLMRGVVRMLQPDFWELYYTGDDLDLRARQAVFTDDQYRAVSAFLGLAFERFPYDPQALYWGWNRIDTPALQAARHYYHEQRSFTYPTPEDPEEAALCQEILAAFEATPYPGDKHLSGTDKGDESAEIAMELRGVRWQSAHPDLLLRNHTALSFLSDAGFRYFFPAFLLAHLSGYGINAHPVFHLTHGLCTEDPEPAVETTDWEKAFAKKYHLPLQKRRIREKIRKRRQQKDAKRPPIDWRAYAIQRFRLFTREERIAIIRYLEYEVRHDEYEYEAPCIQQALANYWLPSLQES